ncbi:MAG TPA: hypothetical protein VKG38_15990, partial [Solirubrobacteraceae bacterium]|nr:hypothetical protein [Solirubrobacteraceae bacterium]
RNFVEQNPSGDYTLPAYSLIRGRKTHRLLDETFGATRIEELPLRFFCVSADLNSRSRVIHRIGPLRDAVFASLAIPGVFPPIPTSEGRLLAWIHRATGLRWAFSPDRWVWVRSAGSGGGSLAVVAA